MAEPTTPTSSPSRIRTPRTPRHGAFADNWEPFSVRKSARIEAKRCDVHNNTATSAGTSLTSSITSKSSSNNQTRTRTRTPSPRPPHSSANTSATSKTRSTTAAVFTCTPATSSHRQHQHRPQHYQSQPSVSSSSFACTSAAAQSTSTSTASTTSTSKEQSHRHYHPHSPTTSMGSPRRTSARLAGDSATTSKQHSLHGFADVNAGRAYLKAGKPITPDKTPRKPSEADKKMETGIKSIARNLFPTSAVSSKVAVAAVDKDEVEGESSSHIEIFTDSQERVPTKMTTIGDLENPFVATATTSTSQTATTRSSHGSATRKMVSIPGAGKVSVEDAIERGDGIVYNFRGKKLWKFHSTPNPADDLDADGEANESADLVAGRSLTRGALKPRLLFPPKPKVSVQTEDEEATTDVEGNDSGEETEVDQAAAVQHEEPVISAPVISTPVKAKKSKPNTPTAPRFAPASPPTTARVTRHRKIADDTLKKEGKAKAQPALLESDTEAESEADSAGPQQETEPEPATARPVRKRNNPFASWTRSKSSTPHRSQAAGHKRGAADLTSNPSSPVRGGGKRQRV